MRDEITKYVYDISTSANSIFEFLGDKGDLKEYESNKLLRRAVERELEIVGR